MPPAHGARDLPYLAKPIPKTVRDRHDSRRRTVVMAMPVSMPAVVMPVPAVVEPIAAGALEQVAGRRTSPVALWAEPFTIHRDGKVDTLDHVEEGNRSLQFNRFGVSLRGLQATKQRPALKVQTTARKVGRKVHGAVRIKGGRRCLVLLMVAMMMLTAALTIVLLVLLVLLALLSLVLSLLLPAASIRPSRSPGRLVFDSHDADLYDTFQHLLLPLFLPLLFLIAAKAKALLLGLGRSNDLPQRIAGFLRDEEARYQHGEALLLTLLLFPLHPPLPLLVSFLALQQTLGCLHAEHRLVRETVRYDDTRRPRRPSKPRLRVEQTAAPGKKDHATAHVKHIIGWHDYTPALLPVPLPVLFPLVSAPFEDALGMDGDRGASVPPPFNHS